MTTLAAQECPAIRLSGISTAKGTRPLPMMGVIQIRFWGADEGSALHRHSDALFPEETLDARERVRDSLRRVREGRAPN